MKQINFINRCQGIGQSYGFASAQSNIEKALNMSGYTYNRSAPVNFAHISCHMFKREEGKFNILWFPYEGWVLPDVMVEQINSNADLLIASCEDNAETFAKSGVMVPIEVCKLGIDTSLFIPDKSKRGDTFRFLWVGQADIRKGWDVIAPAFIDTFKEDENVQLYIKTTHKDNQRLLEANDGKVIVDSRNLATADLIDLYQSSHAFVFPTRGEGTGLPALEAMACGCLTLAPPIMGLKDFIRNETAIPLEYEIINVHYGVSMPAPNVTREMLGEGMRKAYDTYKQCRRVRKQARQYIIDNNSISSMAKSFDEILKGVNVCV